MLPSSLTAPGRVVVDETGLVSVSARVAGWVEGSAVAQAGDLARPGQPLAVLYSPDALGAQQVFLNGLRWERQEAPGSTPSPSLTEQAREARRRLELLGMSAQDIAALEASGQPQRSLVVRAPIRGYVTRSNLMRGRFVPAGSELFGLADLSRVWVIVDVGQHDASRIKVGQAARFTPSGRPGRSFPGRIGFVYPAWSAESRTLQARLDLSNPGLELRPGMLGAVSIDLVPAAAVEVPTSAVLDTGSRAYVFIDQGDGRTVPRPVTTGPSASGETVISSGVAEGERAVSGAAYLLDSESRLRSGDADPGPAR
jgi:RND family efflux transporter MFP subunit